jgi:hypothetical protein
MVWRLASSAPYCETGDGPEVAATELGAYWTWRPRRQVKRGRHPLPQELQALIRSMAAQECRLVRGFNAARNVDIRRVLPPITRYFGLPEADCGSKRVVCIISSELDQILIILEIDQLVAERKQ